MKLHIHTIKEIMRQATKRQITSKAVYLMAMKAEEWIVDKVEKAERLMNERNRTRKDMNLPEKQRITDELLSEVLNDEI